MELSMLHRQVDRVPIVHEKEDADKFSRNGQ
jgi:hypothetical protein